MGAPTPSIQQNPTNQSGKGMASPAVMPQQPSPAVMPNPPMSVMSDDFGSQPIQPNQPRGLIQPGGKGGRITTPSQSGQAQIGQPNNYANTIGPWDNSTNSTQMPFKGKGKGA